MKYILAYICLLTLSFTSYCQDMIKVACVGNSITYGYTLDNPEKDSYPAQLQELLGVKYEVGRFGKPGATLLNRGHRPYTQQQEFHQAVEFAGDIVVIHLGVNDTDPRNWPNHNDEFIRDYISLIDTFKSVNPNCRIIIAQMTPLSHRHHRFESGTRDWHAEIQEYIRNIATIADVELIDFYEPLHKMPHLIPDAIHPNKEGSKIMAEVVYSAITGDYGGLQMPDVYGDNMVLPCNREFTIHGTANRNDIVKVTIDNKTYSCETDYNGNWQVNISPLSTSSTHSLSITCNKEKIKYKNILAGEIWLCSGQSNMEYMLKQCATANEDIPVADNSQIRFLDMKALWRTDDVKWTTQALDSINDLHYLTKPQWTTCNSETAANFSAIGYHFGKMLQDSLNIPIGLICNAVGGSPIESWIDRNTLEDDFPAVLRTWKDNDFIQLWVRERGALNTTNSTNPLQRHPYHPCYMFEESIIPLTAIDIDGVIWYQGESNAHNIETHEKLFPLFVKSWRNNWDNDELPIIFVQLSSTERPSWPSFRDSQRELAEQMENVEMVVSSDKGDRYDVHPKEKREIGQRLARVALNKTYSFPNITPSGPYPTNAFTDDKSVIVEFDFANRLKTSDNNPPSTFEVAEYDGLFYPADATIVDDKIILTCPQVNNPRFVRYGWQPYTNANLVNGDNLPTSTFKIAIERKDL